MKFKIDTKEVFHVISIEETRISANMTDEIRAIVKKTSQGEKKNIILNLKTVEVVEPEIFGLIVGLQSSAQEEKRSFVVCELNDMVRKKMIESNIMDRINYAPTESEAWDIIQMEEIERELDAEI